MIWLLCVHINVDSLGKHSVLVTSKLLFHVGVVFILDILPATQGNCTLPPRDLLKEVFSCIFSWWVVLGLTPVLKLEQTIFHPLCFLHVSI